ncbi:MAG: flagellin FliC [Rickettsiales bacterium]|nr:flagellin FliC [Rickettsiales bacterium]|tara:strand:+ start:1763 stop:2596 length:834 start_codon:yes stop_codon:yes gene_type:complete
MPLRINNNISSQLLQKTLGASQSRLQKNFNRLASGLRISQAADDAAGLGISESLRAEMRGLQQASRNVHDGMSMVATAEGAMAETGSRLSRMRELAVQASSGTYNANDRAAMQAEFSALQTEVDRIANSSEFNGIQLGDGSTPSVDVQVGAGNVAANDRMTVNLQDGRAATLGVDAGSIDLTSQANAQTAISAIDNATATVNTARAAYGAAENSLQSASRNLQSYSENLYAAESRIRDVDFAAEFADKTRNDVLGKAGVSLLAQANLNQATALGLLK